MLLKESNACNISNSVEFAQLFPDNLMRGLLLIILTLNTITFFFSIGWLVYMIRNTISLRKELKGISRKTSDVEVRRNLYNILTQYNRNLLILCILVVEALHLIIKGMGFGLFFVFEQQNETNNNYFISSNILNGYGPIKAFRHLQVTLVRIAFTNAFLLLFMVLLSILMIYLFKAYREHKDFKKIKFYFIFGLIQFSVVIFTISAIPTTLYGSFIVALSLIIDYIILIRSRNKLEWCLRRWQYDGGYYEDMQTYEKRRKYVSSFNKWTRAFLISLLIYLFSVLADIVGNWIVIFALNPCFVGKYYKLHLPIPQNLSLKIIGNLAYLLFIVSNLGTLQFDLFLLFSNLVYYIITHCYFTTPYRDRAIRNNVNKMIWKIYHQPLLSEYRITPN